MIESSLDSTSHFNNFDQKLKPSNLNLNITIPSFSTDFLESLPESPVVPSQPTYEKLDSAFVSELSSDNYYLELTDDHTQGMERYARESVRLAIESTKKLTVDYKITSFLGWGEHGAVLGATRLLTRKPCVIKLIYKKNEVNLKPCTKTPEEILLFKTFNHPNILQFIEHFEDEDNYFLVTSRIVNYSDVDLIDEDKIQPWDECISIETPFANENIIRVPLRNGQCDLFSYLEKKQTLPIDKIKKIVFGLVKSVHYLHTELNITHGDIKEENVLINQKTFQSYLTDFGKANVRVKDKDGTLEYVPPEFIPNFRIKNKMANNKLKESSKNNNSTKDVEKNSLRYESGFEADIWALGILLYSCSTGLLSAREHLNFFELCSKEKYQKKYYPIEKNLNFNKIKKERDLVDLIKGMLTIDVKERYTIEECLNHKFFNDS
ncbi:hypothetical protein HK099_001585 [Clydaea vesicula]|uniref:Protein kinase domain-containing protein n=1 Tax=Clydaea vesicula TaxID=447962 RepID=A0AAD5U3D1_9FUNG|nr:hypothetical protein HK099_001585 [Clydaea vesicula]